jgi:uncharacterized protein YegP (UPF0339 family)
MVKYHKSKNGQHYVTIVAKNGRVLFTSETYKRKSSAKKAVDAVQKIFTGFDAAKEIKKVMSV